MDILLSIISDKFSTLLEFWQSPQAKSDEPFYEDDRSRGLDLGGLLAILNWEEKKIKKITPAETPSGFDYDGRYLYVALGKGSIGIFSHDLVLRRTLSHPYFNDLHALNKTSNGLLVASTGLDTIIEIDNQGRTLFEWFATEHGFSKDKKGRERKIDKQKSHRYIKYPTFQQTTHLNSAIEVGKTCYYQNTTYCSLFHQGKVIAINKENGNWRKVLDSLHHPHSIYKAEYGFMISDTENNRVILTDDNFKPKKIIPLELNRPKKIPVLSEHWIQDASFLPNKNLLVVDSNNCRLLEVNPETHTLIDEFTYNQEWKIYQAKYFQ